MDAKPTPSVFNGLPGCDKNGAVCQNGVDDPVLPVKHVSPSSFLESDESGDVEPVRKKRKVTFRNPKAASCIVGGKLPRHDADAEQLFHRMVLDRKLFPHETPVTFFNDIMGCTESPSDLVVLYFWGVRNNIDECELDVCKEKMARLLVSDLLTRLYPFLSGFGSKRFKDCVSIAQYYRKREKEGGAKGSDVDIFLREKLSWYAVQHAVGPEENDLNRSYNYFRIFGQEPSTFIAELMHKHLPVRELSKRIIQDAKNLMELARDESPAS